MFIDSSEFANMISKLGKKLGVVNKKVTIDELSKKIINKNLSYQTTKKTFDLTEPSLTSAFFLNNVKVSLLCELDSTVKFDLDLLVKIKQINREEYELLDYKGNKIRVNKTDIKISLKKEIDLDLFLSLM